MKAYSPIFIVALAFVVILSLVAPVSGGQEVRVTYLKADVFIGHTQTGPWQTLKKGMSVTEGKFIKTGETGVVELTLPDNSTIRLSAGTMFKLSDVHFPEDGLPKFSAKLFLGRMWTKVSSVVSKKNGTFETHLPTAVVGVRGTVYNLDVAADTSADVSVFKGIVCVGPPLFVEGAPKEEIAWPMEVTEKKWEEIILKQLQRLHIGADGKPGKPQSFDPVKEKDEWILWNQERDMHPA